MPERVKRDHFPGFTTAALIAQIWVAPPATATSPGIPDQLAWDNSYFYICVATNTWKRVAIATWTE